VRLWRVTTCDNGTEPPTWYYSDVIGAATALDAVRRYVAAKKLANAEDTAMWRGVYDNLVGQGRMSDGKGGVTRFEDWHQPEALPQECMAVPALETATYHDRCVSSDRKYESEAFNALWNWARAERVRL
jgi:hypothetical protein